MNIYRKIHNPYDISFKYSSIALNKRLHEYLGLPGTYERRYPTEVVTRDMENRRMDELYKTEENMLINLEEESSTLTENTLKKFAIYRDFARYIYAMPVITVVICLENPPKDIKEYFSSPTDILRPLIFHFSEKELLEKLKNVENKVKNNKILNDEEALDIAFVPKYMPKQNRESCTKKMCKLFKKAIIEDRNLKMDIAYLLSIMVNEHIKDDNLKNRYMEGLKLSEYGSELIEFAHELLKDELEGINEEISIKNKEIDVKNKEIDVKNKEIDVKNKEISQKDLEINKLQDNYEKTEKTVKQLHKDGIIDTPTMNKILQTIIINK